MDSGRVSFGGARLLIGEANFQTRQGLKSALAERGVRNVVDTADIGLIEETVAADDVDLVICDTEVSPDRVNSLVRRVRHHEVGANPFLVVITLTTSPTKESINQIINSGTDYLLAKPFSSGALIDRLVNLTRSRKPFVVTSDYIGPTRRKTHRPGTEKIPEIEVPNTFRTMAAGDVDPASLRDAIDQSITIVNTLKLERHAVQIAYLADQLVTVSANGAPDKKFGPLAGRLLDVLGDLTRRLEQSANADVVGMCEPMETVADRLVNTQSAPDPEDIGQLVPMAAAIKSALLPVESVA